MHITTFHAQIWKNCEPFSRGRKIAIRTQVSFAILHLQNQNYLLRYLFFSIRYIFANSENSDGSKWFRRAYNIHSPLTFTEFIFKDTCIRPDFSKRTRNSLSIDKKKDVYCKCKTVCISVSFPMPLRAIFIFNRYNIAEYSDTQKSIIKIGNNENF